MDLTRADLEHLRFALGCFLAGPGTRSNLRSLQLEAAGLSWRLLLLDLSVGSAMVGFGSPLLPVLGQLRPALSLCEQLLRDSAGAKADRVESRAKVLRRMVAELELDTGGVG